MRELELEMEIEMEMEIEKEKENQIEMECAEDELPVCSSCLRKEKMLTCDF